MTAEQPRRFWQIHLSTASVLLFIVCGSMWVSFQGNKEIGGRYTISNTESHFVIIRYGWPCVVREYRGLETDDGQDVSYLAKTSMSLGFSNADSKSVAVNMGIVLLTSFMIWLALEYQKHPKLSIAIVMLLICIGLLYANLHERYEFMYWSSPKNEPLGRHCFMHGWPLTVVYHYENIFISDEGGPLYLPDPRGYNISYGTAFLNVVVGGVIMGAARSVFIRLMEFRNGRIRRREARRQ